MVREMEEKKSQIFSLPFHEPSGDKYLCRRFHITCNSQVITLYYSCGRKQNRKNFFVNFMGKRKK